MLGCTAWACSGGPAMGLAWAAGSINNNNNIPKNSPRGLFILLEENKARWSFIISKTRRQLFYPNDTRYSSSDALWFPCCRLLLCRAAPRCESRIPLHECDAWSCWKRTCTLSRSRRERERERKQKEGGLDKTTTQLGHVSAAPCSDWSRPLGPETARAASKPI